MGLTLSKFWSVDNPLYFHKIYLILPYSIQRAMVLKLWYAYLKWYKTRLVWFIGKSHNPLIPKIYVGLLTEYVKLYSFIY